MIEVKNLVKRYGDHVAVNNLSFTVEEGQIYGFLGPNGAGKSTTMNIITGYLASTEGEVLINGHNILEEPEEAKKCIGYLPELPPVYTDMTVLEYLKFVAELKKIPKDQRKKQILEVMNLVKITDIHATLCHFRHFTDMLFGGGFYDAFCCERKTPARLHAGSLQLL